MLVFFNLKIYISLKLQQSFWVLHNRHCRSYEPTLWTTPIITYKLDKWPMMTYDDHVHKSNSCNFILEWVVIFRCVNLKGFLQVTI